MKPIRHRNRIFVLLPLSVVFFPGGVAAQDKAPKAAPVTSCSRDNALNIIDRQIDLSKTIDNDTKRIALLLRHLYSTIDPNRAVALLAEVVKTVNHVESVDLSSDRINKHVEGKAFGTYRTLQTRGFSPEAVFREMGKLDFDGTLYLASNLNDKSVRGMAALAIADQCLKDLPPPPKPKQDKTAPPKPD